MNEGIDVPTYTSLRRNTLRLPVSMLTVDPAIAPDIDPDSPAVSALVRDYDPAKLDELIVSDRIDGTIVVLDGYLRRQATLLADPDADATCITYLDLTLDQERHLRASSNADADPQS